MTGETAPVPPAEEGGIDWSNTPLGPVWERATATMERAQDAALDGIGTMVAGAFNQFAGPIGELIRGVIDWVQGKVQVAFGNDSEFGNTLVSTLQTIEDTLAGPATPEAERAPAAVVATPSAGPQ